jgi:hypothetical protein
MADDPLWRLKLRYGRLKTAFSHHAILMDGVPDAAVQSDMRGFFAISIWAPSSDEAIAMARCAAETMGFRPDGRTYVYAAEPREPPLARPHGYGVTISRYPAKARRKDDDE